MNQTENRYGDANANLYFEDNIKSQGIKALKILIEVLAEAREENWQQHTFFVISFYQRIIQMVDYHVLQFVSKEFSQFQEIFLLDWTLSISISKRQ